MRRSRRSLGANLGRIALAILVGTVILAAVVAFIGIAAEWLAATEDMDDAAQRAEELGRARTVVLAVLGGTLAAIGAYYTHRTFGLSRQGQITERFTRAVDQLGNRESMDVRLGGIYALERVARESADDHGPIVDILTAFIRERTPIPPEDFQEEMVQAEPDVYPEPPTADVQAALTVLGRREVSHDPPAPWRLNLSGCFLPKANLKHAQLGGASLTGTVLTQATLTNANLASAALAYSHLYMTDLTDADLSGADLRNAFANRATLRGARLRGAEMLSARFGNANLEHADLSAATLAEALLSGADLAGARLAGAILTGARYDGETTWPQGIEPEAEGARRVK